MSARYLPIRGRWIVVAALLLAAWLVLRIQAGGAEPAVATQPAAQTPLPQPGNAMSEQLTREQIEARVKADLAAYLGVPVAAIATLEVGERVWYTDSLGCRIRSGVPVDPPIPGYLLRLEHDSATYNYHTDRQGHFIRCPELNRPRDRTTR